MPLGYKLFVGDGNVNPIVGLNSFLHTRCDVLAAVGGGVQVAHVGVGDHLPALPHWCYMAEDPLAAWKGPVDLRGVLVVHLRREDNCFYGINVSMFDPLSAMVAIWHQIIVSFQVLAQKGFIET